MIERPRDQIVAGADDRHLPLDLEALVLVLDVEERALEPIETVVERAVVEAAFLDRNAQLLVERADADDGQVELHLHRHVDAARQAVEEAQLAPGAADRRLLGGGGAASAPSGGRTDL